MTNKYFIYYDRIISRAKNRDPLNCYTELHHIIPRCMGGTDNKENLVELTPEEHYTCHLLLVKMYPDSRGLACAAHLMSGFGGRVTNKKYAWMRKRYIAMISKPKPSKEELYKLYIIDELSSKKISKIYQVDQTVCTDWLKYYNIKARKSHFKKYNIDEDELIKIYIDTNCSIKEILKHYKCAYPFVKKVLEKHNIPLLGGGTKRKIPPPPKQDLLNFYFEEKLALWEIAEIYGVTRTPVTRWFKNYNIPFKDNKSYITIPTPPYDELLELYVNCKQSLSDISLKFGAKTSHTAKKWMIEYGIPIRTRNEQNKFKRYRES